MSKKVHDLVLQDREVKEIVEDTCLSYHLVYNIVKVEWDTKIAYRNH